MQLDGSVASEADSTASVFQSRAETLTTLRQLASAPTALADRVAQESAPAIEILARKSATLAPLGRDVSQAIAAILAKQNADGGFGGAQGYQSNALDTSYALRALKAAGVVPSSAVANAVAYLQASQAANGSFSIAGEPLVYVTVEALQALAAFRATYSVTASVASARAWLVSQQQQGAYGGTLANAQAILALLSASSDTTGLPGVVGALTAAQSENGSWGHDPASADPLSGDPYLTALALRALAAAAEVLPQSTTGQVSGTVVETASGAALPGVAISLTGAQSASATTDAQGGFAVGALAPGSYTLQASKAGYSTASIAVTIASGATSRVGTLRLETASTTATIQGTVREGAGGTALVGASVAVSPGASTVTDAAGAYRLAGLAPGAVTITVSKTGYDSVTAAATLAANVVYNFSPTLYAPGQGPNTTSLKGKVVDSATGQPIAGATAKVGSIAAASSSTGEFLLEGLTAGSVSLEVSMSGYRTNTVSGTLAQGVNDAGTIALERVAATLTVSGRISDAVSNLPIGGAVVHVQSTTLGGTTNSNGNYVIAGVGSTTFTLEISAPGYQAKNVPVALPSMADTAIDVTLDKVIAGAITLKRVTTNLPSYPPYATIEIEAEVTNSASVPADLHFRASIQDAAGNTVQEAASMPVTIPASSTGAEVELETHNNNLPAGTYSLVVRAYDGSDHLQAEGTASFIITALAQIAGDVTVDPPILQAGSSQPVHLTASFANYGNLVIPAGQAQLSITLLNPEAGVATAHIDLLPGVTAGDPLYQPIGAGFDAQGNFYTVDINTQNNPNNRRIVKIAPDGTMSTVKVRVNGVQLDALPAQLTSPTVSVFPVDAVVDAAGNIYILNSLSEIFTIAASDGTLTRRQTAISGFLSFFDRDTSGNFHVVSAAPTRIWKLPPTGAATFFPTAGLSGPRGIVRSSDGNLYVTNSGDVTVSRIAPDGAVTPFIFNNSSPPPALPLNSPLGITADASGNLYVANNGDGKILKITPAGVVSQYATGLSSPTDLHFDLQGVNLYVSASDQDGVYKIGPNGSPVEVFARTLTSRPSGMQYDAAGNLFVVASSQVVKKTPADTVSTVATGLCTGREVAIGPANEAYATSSCFNTIVKIAGTTATAFASALTPVGAAVANGKLYVTEASGAAQRVTSFDISLAAPAGVSVAESLVRTPRSVRIAANGDRYVLNADSIARVPASGAAGTFVVSNAFGSAGASLALVGGGGFLVQEANAVRRLDANGAAVWLKTGLNTLAYGVIDAAGNALVGDTTARRIVRVDSAGGVTPVNAAAFAAAPAAIADDLAGGAFVALTSGHLVRVDSSGTVTALTTTPLSPPPTRIAYDSAAGRIYYVTGAAGIRTFDLASKAVGAVPNVAKVYSALELSAGQIFATSAATRELVSIAAATGQSTALAAGFFTPGPIVWTGSQLIFSDDTFTFALTPGSNPAIIANEKFTHLAWRAGTLYGTRGDANVYAFTPGVDSAARIFLSPPGGVTRNMEGLAFRADGLLTVANGSDGAAWSYLPGNSTPVATYAGINGAQSIAVDAAGNVYVNSRGDSNIVRIPPTGRQSTVFAAGVGLSGMALDAGGTLYGTNSGVLMRFAADGSSTTLASGAGIGLWGLVVEPAGIYAADLNGSMVRKLVDGAMAPFAVGLVTPKGLRVDATGAVLISSQGNGTVVRLANGKLDTRAVNLDLPRALGFLASGELLVGGARGHLYSVAASGQVTTLGNLPAIYGSSPGSFAIDSLAVSATGTIGTVSTGRNAVDRIVYTPAGGGPQAGTVIPFSPTASFAAIPVGAVSAVMDFGTWTPPYAGDFQIRLRPAGTQVAGEATNVLHVGPTATASMSASPPVVAPGAPTVSVTMVVDGADFTSLARPDPRSISVVVPEMFGGFIGTFGADAAGRIYATTGIGGTLSRFEPGSVTPTSFFTLASGTITTIGALPVDDAQNVYVSSGVNLIRVKPDANGSTGTGTTIASLPENIRSLVRASDNTIYALGQTSIYHVEPDGTNPWKVSTVPTGVLGQPYNFTIDGKDNLYYLGGGGISVVRKDGTRANLVQPLPEGSNAQPTFEGEGWSIAGDCADNVFITPFNWSAMGGQQGEEHTLVHLIGRTGRASSIFDGARVRPVLNDLDAIVFDRFSSSLLIWADSFRGVIHRIPVTCGVMDTDLHVVFPATSGVSGFSVTPKATLPRADGSREYVWSFKDVTTAGKAVKLSATLAGMQYGESRAIATEAYLTFNNTFAPGELRVPVDIPQVRADPMVDLAVTITDSQYGANTVVPGSVHLSNRNVSGASPGTLLVEITNTQGERLAVVGQQAVTIPANGTLDVATPFNTGTYLTGAYVMKATFTAPGGIVLAQGTAGFYIVAVGDTLAMGLSTDRKVYEASGTVAITARVRNVSLNAIASGLTLRVKVRNPAAQEIFSSSATIDVLVPQALKNSLFPLRLDRAAPGNYEVEATLLQGAAQVGATQYASFSVLSTADTGTGLAGAITVTRSVAQGDSADITATVKNMGNAAVSDLGVTIQVVNPATGQQYVQWTEPAFALAAGDSREVPRSWNTAGVPDGTYVASATATVQSRTIALGQDSIRVLADTTPDAFSFAAQTNVALDTDIVSESALISGISAAVPISVVGGAYSVNGGAWTTASGTVAAGSQVRVRVRSSASLGTTASATLTVSSVSATFSVTTTSEDHSPDTFSFASLSNVPLDTLVVSNEVVIGGINVPVAIAAIGGEYSVNGGTFTAAPSMVSAGDRVSARVRSSTAFSTTTTMSVSVSDVSATFSVTTLAQDSTPDAFAFAPRRNVPLATTVVSNSITVGGINTQVSIAVSGGEYKVNSGAYTSAAGMVVQGDTVTVRLTSAATFATKATATLTISNVSAAFDATTIPFDLVAQTNVPVSTVVSSNAATMAGIATTAPISVAGGEYSVNGGDFTATASTVHNGDVVVVRQTSSALFATATTAALTVGDYTAALHVTTVPFVFTAQVDAPLSSAITSNTATMAGIATTSPISIAGGAYSLNGAAFTTVAGSVANGDTVVVRQTSSASFSTRTTATLTVGDYAAPFDVTTLAEDRVPDAFAFAPETDVPRNSLRTSNTITVSGINTTVPVAITGGEYRVNSGAWLSTPSLVVNGDQVTVRLTSAAAFSSTSSVTLSVSGVLATFAVTTLAEDIVPDAFAFTAQIDVPLGTVRVSSQITIAGINSSAPISIAPQGGATAAQYSVNGQPFTSAAGLVVNGDNVVVRQTASASFSTKTSIVLSVSSVSAAFEVTTLAEDRVPDAFAFAARRNVPFNTSTASNEITVSGINTSVPVSIAGGEYSLNGAAFTTAAGSVVSGDKLTVRLTSAGAFATTRTAMLTVSTATAPFDVTTIPFDFTAQVNVALSTVVSSNAATMAGIATTAPISIAGGEYSLNAGAFTAAPATVHNGDLVVVRQTSSATFATKSTATLTVGDYTAPFDVTTVPFLLPAQLDVPLSTVIASDPATMAGLSAAAQISVAGGEYSVNGTPFTTAAGSVANGDQVIVRQLSSASFSTKTTATLTVGGYSAPFEVTTLAERRTPEPFSFPPEINVPVQSPRISDAVTILGINTTVPISIAGGEYSINGAPYTASAGTAKNGDIVKVRQTSASAFATKTSAVLTVSTVSASFDVTTVAVAQVNLALQFNGDTRLLVLVSCRRSDEVDGSTDDSDVGTCLGQRHAFLETYLASLGFVHKIVDTTGDFRTELRSGRYNTYWITGGVDKLKDGLDAELIEAVVRGEALVLDGMHDERNKSLDPILGFTYKGKPSGLTTVTLSGSFLPPGSFTVSGHKPVRVALLTGTRQASFNSGDPAIVTNAWGYGKALMFAFDLTGTLLAQSATALLTPMFEASVDYVAAAAQSSYTGGAYAPLVVELHNTEPVPVDVEVTATVPSGFQLAAGSPPATLTGNQLKWTATIPAGASLTLEWAVRVPGASGSYSIPIDVKQVYAGSSTALGSRSITITVVGAATQLPQTISALQGLTLASNKDRKARDDAVASLQQAQAEIARAAWETAIARFVDAAGHLDDVNGVSVSTYLGAIGRFVQEAGERWYQALPPCPATPACR